MEFAVWITYTVYQFTPLSGQAGYNAACSYFVTKKLYSIQNPDMKM